MPFPSLCINTVSFVTGLLQITPDKSGYATNQADSVECIVFYFFNKECFFGDRQIYSFKANSKFSYFKFSGTFFSTHLFHF